MENAIEVKNLTKSFSEIHAVQDVSFEVKRGEVFAFLGPNGAGKSTTIKMLTTLLRPTSGSASVVGTPVNKTNDVRRKLGIVFQDSSLDDELTGYENLSFHAWLYGVPKKEHKERIAKLGELIELTDRLKDRVSTYSGGMKRRLEIARSFLHVPEVIFLDEPTLGLDPQTRNKLWQYLLDLNTKEGVTIFFTTHYMDEAERYAKRIGIIDHGKLIALGTPDELKQKTSTTTIEGAFLALTGNEIRDEEGTAMDRLRTAGKAWGRR